ncbi:hypothetical protein BD324DRAFT_641616 [Kockovaella imperatae]|uniref:non-specific serine/threonine protein kinase n=1 Tax=Kockovaella imperatae TaxID=4999 RepID=A0A1Y1UKG8_9TREE|nr:hypothetical protein BD324DRAFT_641616 [Kockovaella imperatae]ORX38472.1 hypothetical protein BD324DRAFT_641616 [Kockovaella imperatae]
MGEQLTRTSSHKSIILTTLGSISRHARPNALGLILELLMRQLGSPSSPLRSLAYTNLLSICRHHSKSPMALISPYLEQVSIMLVASLSEAPDTLTEAASFLGQTRQNFIETTLHYTIPAMILARNRMCLEQMASTLPTGLGVTLLEYTAQILTKIFLCPSRTDQCLAFLVNLVSQLVHDTATTHIDAPSLITSCIVPLLVALVIELGDEEAEVSNSAAMGLRKVRDVYQVTHRSSSLDLGTFLKPHMLGVMTHLNETLHDVRGRKSAAYKRKLIRSLKTLIEMVGDSIASYSPQVSSIMASLQITLQTWLAFIRTLRYSDIGPFVGRTTATLVANWASFDPNDRGVAKDIVSEIADNAKHLSAYLDDIVGLDHIPELRSAGDKLTASRKGLGFAEQLAKLLERVRSKNIAVATTSIRELRDVLLDHPRDRSALAEGDAFHPLVASTMQTLLSTSSRDAEFMSFCDMAYECLGIVGALDPDRCVSNSDSGTMTIMSNFNDPEESVDFAIHLVRDLLVDAFRATNDTKLQGHLAFAIQELLQFCGFSPKLLQSGSSGGISLRTRTRWTNLPKDQHETLTPLLESRFTLTDGTMPTFSHPIYGSAPTYREWLQRWTLDLIGQVMQLPLDNRATRDSQTIFGVFRGVLKNQDAAVAHHILPHLVLNVLLSGGADAREQISQEINAVLQDQVSQSSAGSADKRTWSAQVVFDLMDHLSKWQRLQRIGEGRSEKHSTYRAVDAVLSTIEVELMANAALQSKAYARALRGFEQRITQLRRTRRANTDLQTYFEKLHLVYANLNEPDGMEGVSTFVIAPSLEHQIREHESTGRWTSAQSCWEVRLQQSPNDVTLHQGLLHCLRNLGHYDTLRTHIRGILSLHPEWSRSLATFEAEAACITGEWQTIRRLDLDAPPIARLLLALHDNRDLVSPLLEARRKVGISITSNSYPRMYDQVMDLHLLREVEIIKQADTNLSMSNTDANRRIKARDAMSILTRELGQRFETLAPSFQVREQVLSIRRAAFGLTKAPELRAELGTSWIQSSKIARKSGYEQTAYSAILQAQQAEAPYAFTEKAKLLRAQSGAWKALFELENMAQPILEAATGDDSAGEDYDRDRNLAKVLLLEARWAQESDRFEANLIVDRYKEAIKLAPKASHNLHTCHNYILALQHGVKYIFQTMPRMLTLWLDLGEHKDLKKHPEIATSLVKITAMIDRSRRELASYQYFTAYPQIVSRIGHPVKEVSVVLVKIMSMVLEHYPQQALWPTIGVMQSIRPERKTKCQAVLTRAQHRDHGVALMIQEALRLGSALLRLTEEGTDKRKELSLSLAAQFPYVRSAVPSRMMVPLQEALTCTLPSTSETVKSHNPFPDSPVEIRDIDDKIEVMPSLQRPKKLVLIGTDGKRYPFLCKPHDDLRKDARLMDLNGMINKLLKSASDSRRRRLYIRTYAVMPLNEECGLLQWVSNTKALKSILEQGYLRQGKRIYPSAWLASRLSYSRTLAVMSMIGYVLGLGDRHGENILFDSLTGDTVHVDLNCLFDKGKTFEIPEKVPFRLTQNMVDALGVTGVEGVFRKAAEIALAILRDNTDALMSVLEAFAHDPLVEWSSRSGRSKSDKDVGIIAEKNLKPIRAKLQGIMDGAVKTSVPNQVEALIKEATSPSNLGVMYLGWAAWL